MTFWVVAGESSGDARAEELLKALRALMPGLRFHGAGGPRMAALAQKPFDDWIAEAGVVGLWDVLRHYGYFRKKFHGMLGSIHKSRPDAVLLVDYPGFNLRLARRLRKDGYSGRILYYISPQVWAWNRGRIAKMAKFLDLMICVFPFEQPMYEASGLKTVFAGHPLLESLVPEKSDAPRESDLVGLFPGSRRREVQRIFPAQLEAARILLSKRPATRFEAAASSEAHASLMRQMAGNFPITISAGHARKLMRRAAAGIVCSGTATLEAAFFGLPYCLIYKTAWLTFAVGRHLVDVDCLGIVNILNNYRINPPADPRLPARPAPHVVREFIQDSADPGEMATEVARLLDDQQYVGNLRENFRKILGDLEAEGASERAARAILDEMQTAGNPLI